MDVSKDSRIAVLIVAGPTATGKSKVAVALAKALDGEIVCADSMQIYQGLPVGTAQPEKWETEQVPHHLYGFLDPAERYSVARYMEDACRTVREVHQRGKLPILCGGTGLYISSFMAERQFAPIRTSAEIRAEVNAEYLEGGAQALIAELAESDPEHARMLHPNDRKRIVRAVELLRSAGYSISTQNENSVPAFFKFSSCCAVLTCGNRAALYAGIERRVDAMEKRGLVEEARAVWIHRDRWSTAAQAIGYKEFFPYFDGEADLETCTAKLKQSTRHYAKRQIAWFKRVPHALWYDIDGVDSGVVAEKIENDYRKNGRL